MFMMYPVAAVRRAGGKRVVWRAKVHVGDAGVPFLLIDSRLEAQKGC